MALNDKQRAELEALGPETVRLKLLQAGADRGASVQGFDTGTYRALTRSDVEDWLAEKSAQEATERKQTLRWAIIAGRASIAGIIIGAILSIGSIIITVLLAK